MLRHQWWWGCCGVQGAEVGSGVGSIVVSVDGVVGEVDDGVGDVVVVRDDVVVDGCVVAGGAGAWPPLPRARMVRP